jgi:hypothetical protein
VTAPLPIPGAGVTAGRTGSRLNTAVMASANDSAVRNAGTPLRRSRRSASGAAGTTNTASAVPLSVLAESTMGLTLTSGLKRAELPGTATTASNSGASSSTSSAPLMVS